MRESAFALLCAFCEGNKRNQAPYLPYISPISRLYLAISPSSMHAHLGAPSSCWYTTPNPDPNPNPNPTPNPNQAAERARLEQLVARLRREAARADIGEI